MFSPEVKKYIKRSVLCWLATSSEDGMPNVSPKEAFTSYQDSYLIIANIASPQTLRNIRQNNKVCVSFIDVFVQKGFQIKGTAEIVHKGAKDYDQMEAPLIEMVGGKFPFASITKIKAEKIKPIIAPSYLLFPETTEESQVQSAIKTYHQFVK